MTYSSSNTNVAIIQNNSIHIVSSGKSIIKASQSGDQYFYPAMEVSDTLIVKNEQSIVFPKLPIKKTNDLDFDPCATASSGLPITYISSDTSIAIIQNKKIHIQSSGKCVISASQTGNGFYLPAKVVQDTLIVLPTTSIKDWYADGLKIYPIPAIENIYIEYPKYPYLVELIDLNGKVIIKGRSYLSFYSMDVSNLVSGIYILKLIRDNQMIHIKIILNSSSIK